LEEDAMTLARAERAIEQLNILYRDVSTHWAASESRVIGHVILSPPIGIDVGDEGYTEDWAVIEIDASKVDATNFNGNAIDLCIQIPVKQFNHKMYLNVQSGPSFAYPKDRLLRLCGTIPDKEMRKMPDLDQNGDPCLIVMKRGVATGLTVGRANNIASYVRHYYGLPAGTSKEWAILPLDSNSAPFSDPGDSGSVV
ncbi:hypothetical protein EDC04DRAFT_2505260, partial [Pisolithus marmoratus]